MKTNKLTFPTPTSRRPVIRATVKRLFGALAALLLWSLPTQAATIVWTNIAGGSWSATNNWSPNQVPAAADEAVITNAGSYTVNLNANATVASLQLGAVSGTQTLHCATTTLTLNGPGLIGTNGAFTLAGGTLAGTGTLTVEGRCDWTAGTWQGAGLTIFAPTAIFNLSGSGQKFLRDRTVTIGCNATWSGGQWYGGYGAVVNLQNGATLEVGSESGAPVWAGAITFNNAGTIRKSTGTGQGYFNWAVNNSGLVDAQTGLLGFYGGGAQTGLFQTAGASTRIHFGGGTHTLLTGADFTGPGLFTIGDSGYVRVQAPLTNGMRWQLLNGGTLGGTNAITFTGPFDWQSGTMQDAGQTIFSPTATLTLSTTGQKFLRDRAVTIGCNATWSGGQWYGGYGAEVSLLNGATFDVQSEAGAPVWAGAITFNNAGTIRKSTGTGQGYFNWTVNNSGLVDAQTGLLGFYGGGTQTGLFQTAGASTRFHFGGGTHDLHAGVDFTGAGLFTIGDTGTVRAQAALTNGMRWQLLNGGVLGGTNSMTFTGPFDWQSGSMQDDGHTIFSPTATLTLSTTGQKFLRDRAVTIGCNATWSGGQWYGGYGAAVSLLNGATFDVQSEAGAPVWAGAITFNNAGTIRKSTGTGQGYFNWTVNNSGLVDAQTGLLGFYGGGTQTGLFQTAGASTRFHFGGGTHDLHAGVDFTGAGLFTIGDTGTVRAQAALTNGMRWQLLNGGVLGGTNSMTFTGPFDWQSGSMQDDGHTIFSPTATLTLSTTGQKFLRDRAVTIGCNATWSGGQWYGGYGAAVSLLNGATFDVQSEAGAPVWAGAVTFNNAGTIHKSTGTGQGYFNWTVNNSGRVDAQTGTLGFYGGGTQAGLFQTAGASTRIHFGGGTHDLRAGVDFTGAGLFTIGDTGTVRAQAALTNGMRWQLLNGGVLGGTNSMTFTGPFDWQSGSMQDDGHTIFSPTATLTLSTTGQKFLRDRAVTIGCNATWSGGQWYGGYGAAVSLLNGATFDVQSEAGAPVWAGAVTFNNAGTIHKSTGTGQGYFNWTVNNSGRVDAQTGTLGFYGGGTQAGLFQTAGASTRIHFGGGTHDLRAGVDFTGAGLFTIGDTGTVRAQAALTNGMRWQLLNGGALGGTNSMTFTGPFDWQAGTMQDSGQTMFSPTATLTLSTTGQKFLRDRAVTIGCNATWSGGQWYGGYGAAVSLLNGATFDVQSEAGAPVWAGAITFNNAGSIRKSTGTGQGNFNWAVNNSGVADAQTGTLGFYGGGAQTGLFQTAGASTRIHFGGGTHDLRAGVNFTGAGQFTIGDTGTVRAQSPLLTGTRWALLNGGVLGGTNSFTFTGPFDWQAGTMQDSGQTIFSPTATLTLSTTGQKFLRDRTVTIGCNATWSGGQWYGGYGAAVSLLNGVTFDVQSEAGAPVWAGAITINNAGTLRKSAGTGTSSFNWTVTNSAAVRAQSGTLGFNGLYIQRSGSTTLAGGNLGGATLDLQGGVLTGAGNIAANVLNRADVSPGGPFGFLSVSNSPAVIYSNTPAGRLNVQLAGLTPGVDYDQLRITGTANLAGTLNVEFLDGFVPAVGNSFTVMTYTARSGAFTNLVAPEGVTLQAVYFPNQLVLNAVAFTQVAPYIVTQPTNVTVRQGLTATFRVVAGGSPTLHYQWQRNSADLPGATGDTLVIPNVTVTNAGSYRVFVSNDGGFTNSVASLLLVEPGFSTVEITTGTTNALTGVSFFNGLEGAIIGVGGWLQITHDGGVTWQVVNTGMTEIRDVQFVGGAIYIVGTGPHSICVSYDGGLTWASSYGGPERIRRIRFLSPRYGFAVGDAGAVLFWNGSSWTPMATGIPVNLWSLDFCGGIPVAVGEAGRIYRFEGTNWVLRYTAVSLPTLNDVRFCGVGGTGFAVGTGGVIYRTTDCGLTWDLYNHPPYSGALNSIAFGNCGTWWIGGDGGTLLISTDGGLNWQTIFTGTTSRITSVVFVDGYGYYVDDSGHCYHFEYAPIPPNAPPLVAMVLPAGPQTNWACTPLVLRAQAADSDGFVTNLQFLADGQPLSQHNPAIYTHCNLGVVTYTATATDNRGARGISGPAKVTYVPAPLHQLIPAGFLGAETNRGFQLCLTGEVGRDYQIFAHTNVAAPFATWDLLGLMTPTNQLYRFRDYDATNLPHRFYRARQVPGP